MQYDWKPVHGEERRDRLPTISVIREPSRSGSGREWRSATGNSNLSVRYRKFGPDALCVQCVAESRWVPPLPAAPADRISGTHIHITNNANHEPGRIRQNIRPLSPPCAAPPDLCSKIHGLFFDRLVAFGTVPQTVVPPLSCGPYGTKSFNTTLQ